MSKKTVRSRLRFYSIVSCAVMAAVGAQARAEEYVLDEGEIGRCTSEDAASRFKRSAKDVFIKSFREGTASYKLSKPAAIGASGQKLASYLASISSVFDGDEYKYEFDNLFHSAAGDLLLSTYARSESAEFWVDHSYGTRCESWGSCRSTLVTRPGSVISKEKIKERRIRFVNAKIVDALNAARFCGRRDWKRGAQSTVIDPTLCTDPISKVFGMRTEKIGSYIYGRSRKTVYGKYSVLQLGASRGSRSFCAEVGHSPAYLPIEQSALYFLQ